jgi:hypothetical protein
MIDVNFFACPLPGCHAVFDESKGRQSVTAHINKELAKDPALVHAPSMQSFMRCHGYWFCTACCGIFKKTHKQSHARPAGCPDLIVEINGTPAPRIAIAATPRADINVTQSCDLNWSTLFPQCDTHRPLDLYPDLEIRLRSNRVPMISHPPSRLVKPTCLEFTKLLADANSDPSNPHKHILVSMFVVCVLRRVKRNEPGHNAGHAIKQGKYTRALLDKWCSGPMGQLELLEEVLNYSSNTNAAPSTQEANFRRARKLLALGRFSDATKAITSKGVAEVNESVYNSLLAKHPARTTEPMPPDGIPPTPMIALPEQVCKALLSFKKGTASGCDGLLADMLKSWYSIVSVRDSFIKALTDRVNLLLAGKIPAQWAPFIASAPLIPLAKPDGGVRPIAVGEVLRRLTSKVALLGCLSESIDYLNPLQVGVSSPAGMEKAFFQFQDLYNEWGSDPSYCALFMDFSNAFNAVDREALFKQVRAIIPSIATWVEFCYRAEPILFVGKHQIKSSCGVQQGDPLGPLLFAITLQPLVLRIQSECPDLLLNKWYLDDGTIFGKIADVCKALAIVMEDGPSFGLCLNESKTVLFNGAMDLDALSIFPPRIVRCQDAGVKFLGAGAGDASFMNLQAQKRVIKIKEVLDCAKGLEDPQLELLLLRSCIGVPKFAFLLRMCPLEHIYSAISNLDSEIDSFLLHILNVSFMDSNVRNEIALPIREGGLGIPIVKDIAPVQFLSASRGYVLSLNPSSDIASKALEDRLSEWNSTLDQQYHVAWDDFIQIPKRPQTLLNSMWFASTKANLLSIASGAQLARLESNFSSSARWSRAPPIPGLAFVLDPGAFRIALRFRLGLEIRGSKGPCSHCQSGLLDKLGIHDSRCKRVWSAIHNHVRDALYVILKKANIDVKKEVPDLLRDGSDDRPADLLITHPNGKSECLDLSCVSYDVKEGMKKRDAAKVKKYGARCEAANLEFKPLSFNPLGAISDTFQSFLKLISRSRADFTTAKPDVEFSNVMQSLQFAIIRIVSNSMHDHIANDLAGV